MTRTRMRSCREEFVSRTGFSLCCFDLCCIRKKTDRLKPVLRHARRKEAVDERARGEEREYDAYTDAVLQ
jgi:hypothetical protein